MPRTKIAITLDKRILGQIDLLVRNRTFPNRSRAIENAIVEKLSRLDRTRLARELARIDPAEEKELAEEGLSTDGSEWPEY